ncbi:hypothetical protein M5K25_017253 [Dendrobium thyrsiflorum]|uniref:Uncharacterized protein n=1 Tax=Dendrobium thyrsiflorum TaxID=117978 RepID=A0ABD0UUC7_DENTH
MKEEVEKSPQQINSLHVSPLSSCTPAFARVKEKSSPSNQPSRTSKQDSKGFHGELDQGSAAEGSAGLLPVGLSRNLFPVPVSAGLLPVGLSVPCFLCPLGCCLLAFPCPVPVSVGLLPVGLSRALFPVSVRWLLPVGLPLLCFLCPLAAACWPPRALFSVSLAAVCWPSPCPVFCEKFRFCLIFAYITLPLGEKEENIEQEFTLTAYYIVRARKELCRVGRDKFPVRKQIEANVRRSWESNINVRRATSDVLAMVFARFHEVSTCGDVYRTVSASMLNDIVQESFSHQDLTGINSTRKGESQQAYSGKQPTIKITPKQFSGKTTSQPTKATAAEQHRTEESPQSREVQESFSHQDLTGINSTRKGESQQAYSGKQPTIKITPKQFSGKTTSQPTKATAAEQHRTEESPQSREVQGDYQSPTWGSGWVPIGYPRSVLAGFAHPRPPMETFGMSYPPIPTHFSCFLNAVRHELMALRLIALCSDCKLSNRISEFIMVAMRWECLVGVWVFQKAEGQMVVNPDRGCLDLWWGLDCKSPRVISSDSNNTQICQKQSINKNTIPDRNTRVRRPRRMFKILWSARNSSNRETLATKKPWRGER